MRDSIIGRIVIFDVCCSLGDGQNSNRDLMERLAIGRWLVGLQIVCVWMAILFSFCIRLTECIQKFAFLFR